MAKSDLKKKVKPIMLPTSQEEKKKALAGAIAQIEKNFGKGAIIKLGSNQTMQVDAIPTGSMGLDLALGIGGVPKGRIVGAIRSGKLRQNHRSSPYNSRGSKKRRRGGLCRRRTRA